MARKRKPGGFRKVRLTVENVMPLLREAGIALDGEPETVFGYVDRAGRPCRILARWAKGWRVDLRFRADGSYSLSQSLRLTVAGAERTQADD